MASIVSTPDLNPIPGTPPEVAKKNYTAEKIIALISAIVFTKIGFIGTFFAIALLELTAIPFVATVGICLAGGAAVGLGAYFATFYILKAISDMPASPLPLKPAKLPEPKPQFEDTKKNNPAPTKDPELEKKNQECKSSMQKNFDASCAQEIELRKDLEKINKQMEELKLNPSDDPTKAAKLKSNEACRDLLKSAIKVFKESRQRSFNTAKHFGINIDRSAEVKYGLP